MSKDLTFTNLGARPSDPDYRDRKDATLAGVRPSSFKTDLGPVEVFDQEKIGICTSSIVTYVEWLYWKKTGIYTKLSRRFVYAVGKSLIDQDTFEGSSLRTMLKVVYNYGVPPETVFPSAVNGMSHATYMDINAIPAAAWKEARNYRIGSYVSIPTDKESFLSGLYKYGLLYTRMELGKEWWTAKDGTVTWEPGKIMPLRKPEQVISGHAVTHISLTPLGNNELRNSWGPEWGALGDGWHKYDDYPVTEAWAVTLDRYVNDLPAANEFKYTFTQNLTRGSRGEEVRNLQIALMILGFLDFVQPVDRGYYGALTQEAVKKFLIAEKISPNYLGLYWGPKARTAINKIFAG